MLVVPTCTPRVAAPSVASRCDRRRCSLQVLRFSSGVPTVVPPVFRKLVAAAGGLAGTAVVGAQRQGAGGSVALILASVAAEFSVGDALAVIDAVFTDKMRANAEDDRLGRQRQPFAEFVFDFFLQRYPTTATANAALVSLLLKLNESLPVSGARVAPGAAIHDTGRRSGRSCRTGCGGWPCSAG
jgi:hypothetical protein